MSQLPPQLDCLDVLHNVVFSEISEDLVKDCEKSIYKILKSSKQNEVDFSESADPHKLSSINILLELYRNTYAGNRKNTTKLSLKPVLEGLNLILNSQKVETIPPENHFEKDVTCTLNLLFKIALLHKSQEDFRELAVFYYQNLETINEIGYFSSGLLGMRVKILWIMYDSLLNIKNERVVLSFYEKINTLKEANKLDECKLFAHLVIESADEIAIQMLLLVIPMYVKCFETTKITSIIWNEISNLMANNKENVKQTKMLFLMCYLFDLCLIDNKKELFIILEDIYYWNLIQFGIVQKDSLMKKQGMYLFKKTLGLLESSNENVLIHEIEESSDNRHKLFMKWDSNLKNELSAIYKDIVVILEFLDEHQVHIVKPIFHMVDKLTEKILCSSDNVQISFSWIILIYQKALIHENTQVVKWGLYNLLKLPEKVFSSYYIMKTINDLLVPTLNNLSIYYNENLTLSRELEKFVNKIAHLDSAKIFFSLFIRKLCSLVWSSEALFFVLHALSSAPKMGVWQEEELSEMKKFVSTAFRTHNKIIRVGAQCELLNSIMLLTDGRSASLEIVILLLSSFSTSESLQVGSQVWKKVVNWLRSTYSKEEASKCLENYKESKLKFEFSDRSVAFMIILFFDAYSNKIEHSDCFVINKLSKILMSFNGISKRLYCDKLLYDDYLSIICHILEENFNGEVPQRDLMKIILPYCSEILLYIQMQLKQVSNLKDFHICQLYIKTFEYVLEIQRCFQFHSRDVLDALGIQIISDLEFYQSQSLSKISSVRIYCEMKLLKVLFDVFSDCEKLRLGFLRLCLNQSINEPLKKDESYLEKTRDLQTLWGKMNSEYLEGKWEILEKFVTGGLVVIDFENNGKENGISGEDLIKFCVEGLTIGGYGVLCPVITILKNVLFKWENDSGIEEVVDSIWEGITERRKNDEFKLHVKKFVEMLFHEKLIIRGSLESLLLKYADLLLADSSLVVVNAFIKHIQEMGINLNATSLFSNILAKALIFGPVQKKDERLTIQVSTFIESLGYCTVGEHNTSNEVRARAVQSILNLNKNCSLSQTFAEITVDTLLKLEVDINKNRIRYFGDSHVHRVKHRIMQALLLLEPLLSSKMKVAEKLSKLMYNSLMSENPQPSVKYQQEWLLIRLLMGHDDLLNKFWNYFNDSVEMKTRGLCSLIAITYHLCKLIDDGRAATWIDQAIPTILPFCMDQHFEVRLYAQVVIEKLYELAKKRELNDVINKYKMINNCVLQSIQRGCKGNAGKNCDKLKEDFYLNVFNPFEHYSLQTIYQDLPRLANIGSDEWISPKIFKLCGLDSEKIYISIENATKELEEIDEVKWLVKGFGQVVEEGTSEVSLDEHSSENYQKKMIPLKPKTMDWEESFANSIQSYSNVKKDGLVVVASLIDRIPNLGGLARTCEIFGASEYVVGSLKYIQDKQFTSLSVTAEKWVPVKEVKVHNLSDYILEMKQNGYTVVGAEQALYSQPLSSVKFPKRTLLLLGNEKEGIPPNLIPLLDICVEVPQVGIIRSLNVHVTGALFIWEYAKQNNFP